MRAIWNGVVVAQSDQTEIVESNHYFPSDSIVKEYFVPSGTTTRCFWKGEAHYYTLSVNGEENPDAAWYYPDPKSKAEKIRGFIAFWKGVEVVE